MLIILLYFFPNSFALGIVSCGKLFIAFSSYKLVERWRLVSQFVDFSEINSLQKWLIPTGTASPAAFKKKTKTKNKKTNNKQQTNKTSFYMLGLGC